MATPVIIEIRANASQAQRSVDGLSKSFRNFGASVRSVVAMSSQAVTGVRQMAQGVQNLGFVLSGLVGIPVASALKKMSTEVLTFERAMVEVQKTTGLSTKEIDMLSVAIRELSKSTPTSANELANLASEAGRAGVGLGNMLAGNVDLARAEIIEFTRVVDMMVVSTTLSADEAAKAFGRFMTIFGDIDTTNIENLGSAINELGQSASVSEDEIVGSMLRIAPAASTLGWAAQDVAAFATAITQMSESMSRGGTRVRSALEQMALNYKDAAKLIGISSDEMAQRLNEDSLQVFLDLIEAVSRITDNTEQLATATEIFGTTGANAVQRLANSYPELLRYIDIANKSFDDGSSLQIEFNRALGATTEQLKLLRNNISEVAMIFAQDLLPVAKTVIGALIPAVQELGEWVKQLTVRQKLLAVAMAALVIAGLPLMALLGSIGFAFSMMLNGIVNVIGGLVGLIATILTFGSGASMVGVIVGGLASMLGSMLVVAMLKSTGALDMIIEKLSELAVRASQWGESYVAELAGGIISGISKYLIGALERMAGMIALFFEPGSPPKLGALSTIDNWGEGIMNTFLKGFLNADFGILESVSDVIKHVLEKAVELGEIEDKLTVGPALIKAREHIASLIDTFNKTGVISEAVLNKISNMLGSAGDEVATLLMLQLKYNKSLKDLEAARQKKSDVKEGYSAEVRAIMRRTDITDAERMRLIKSAKQRRDLALDNADTEEAVAQKNVDGLKDQVEWQKNYINSLIKQDDIWSEHMKNMESWLAKLAKGMKGIADKLAELLARLFEQLAVNQKLQKIYKSKGMDITPLLREELSLRERIVKALLTKESLSEEEQALLDSNIDRIGVLKGMLANEDDWQIPDMGVGETDDELDQLAEALETAGESVANIKDIMDKGRTSFDLFKKALSGITLEDMAFEGIDMSDIRAMSGSEYQEFIDDFKNGLEDSQVMMIEWGSKLSEMKAKVVNAFNAIKGRIKLFRESFSDFVGGVQEDIEGSSWGDKFEKYKNIIVPALSAILGGLLLLKGPMRGIMAWSGLGSVFSGVSGGIGIFVDALKNVVSIRDSAVEKAAKPLGKAFGKLSGIFGSSAAPLQGFGKILGNLGPKFAAIKGFARYDLLSGFSMAIESLGGKLGSLKGVILSLIKGGLGALWGALSGGAAAIGSAIASAASFMVVVAGIGAAVVAAGVIVAGVIKYMSENWDRLKMKVEQAVTNIKEALKGFVRGFKEALGIGGEGESIGEVFDGIMEKVEPLAAFISEVLVEAFYMLSSAVGPLLESLGKIFGTVFRTIIDVAGGFLDVLSGLAEVVVGFFGALKSGDWTQFKDGLTKVFGGLGDVFKSLFSGIGGIIAQAFAGVLGFFRNIFARIYALVSGNKILKGIIDFINKIIGFFQGLYDKLVGHSIIPDLVNGITGWFKKLSSFIKNVFSKIGNFLQPFIDKVKSLVGYIKKAATFIKMAFKKKGMAGGLAAIYKAFGPLKKVIEPVLDVIWRFWKIIQPIISAFKEGYAEGGLKGAFESLKEILPTILPMLGGLLGSLMTMFPRMLASLAGLFIEKVLPAIVDFVVKAWEYLKTNVPMWITAILSTLGDLATKIWTWIKETGLPMLGLFVSGFVAYIKENGPGWLKAFLDILGTVASGIWGFITTKLIPWAGEMISSVATVIKRDGPSWLAKLLAVLSTIAIGLWNFILNDAIPWVSDMISQVAGYIRENGPSWLASVVEILGTIATGIATWVVQDAIPAIASFVTDGVKELGRIAKEWLTPITTGLQGIYDKFVEVFDNIKAVIVGAIVGALNTVITKIENAINSIVGGINWFIGQINKFAGVLPGFQGLPNLSKISIPRIQMPALASGGIVTSPMMALIGEGREDEAVLPLSRLDGMISSAVSEASKQSVTINIRDNTVRNDDDLQAIVDQVSYKLGLKLDTGVKTLGRAFA